MRSNPEQAFYSTEIAEKLAEHGVKVRDVMANVRRWERRGLVYVRGYKTEEKKKALKEIHRTLSGGGRLLVMDLDKPHNPLMYLISLVIGRLEESSDNIKGHIPQFIEGAGFAVENLDRFSTVYGTISIYRAHK